MTEPIINVTFTSEEVANYAKKWFDVDGFELSATDVRDIETRMCGVLLVRLDLMIKAAKHP